MTSSERHAHRRPRDATQRDATFARARFANDANEPFSERAVDRRARSSRVGECPLDAPSIRYFRDETRRGNVTSFVKNVRMSDRPGCRCTSSFRCLHAYHVARPRAACERFGIRTTRRYFLFINAYELSVLGDDSSAGARCCRRNRPKSSSAAIARTALERALRATQALERLELATTTRRVSRTTHRARRRLAAVAPTRRGVRPPRPHRAARMSQIPRDRDSLRRRRGASRARARDRGRCAIPLTSITSRRADRDRVGRSTHGITYARRRSLSVHLFDAFALRHVLVSERTFAHGGADCARMDACIVASRLDLTGRADETRAGLHFAEWPSHRALALTSFAR